jgi:serine/threonine-protein kinase
VTGAASDPLVGRRLVDRYRVDALIARGGMARVYRARDERLDRDVAIKVLSAPYADDPPFVDHFLEEARAAASLTHPSLVHVYDSGSDEGAHFFVMELLDRHSTLRSTIDERGPMPPADVVRIGRELLAGLRVVHGRGLVHCDVKASNVMLGPGPAKLIDFGIARPPDAGNDDDTSLGSLHAMSPEQLHGEPLTPASDLFSLGVVLYEPLTARRPFDGATPAEVARQQDAGAVRPPSTLVAGVPGRLDAAILQALRRDPAARFRTAEAMDRALDAASADRAVAPDDETRVVPAQRGPVPPSAPPPPRAPSRAPRQPAPPRRRASGRPAGGALRWIGTAAVLGAAALVVLLLVVPLLELGRGGGGASPSQAAEPTPPPTVEAGVVPDTVGLPTADAIELARAAGLKWTVRCNQDQAKPAGIIDQEPPAGTPASPGSAFTMYSARISDCR